MGFKRGSSVLTVKFTTRPQGIWANFTTNCATCGAELTVTNSRPDPHTCRINLDWHADMQTYYTNGAQGLPPKHPLDDRK